MFKEKSFRKFKGEECREFKLFFIGLLNFIELSVMGI